MPDTKALARSIAQHRAVVISLHVTGASLINVLGSAFSTTICSATGSTVSPPSLDTLPLGRPLPRPSVEENQARHRGRGALMAAIAESTLQMEFELPIAPCSRCRATVSATWTSTTLSALWALKSQPTSRTTHARGGPPTALLEARPHGQQPGRDRLHKVAAHPRCQTRQTIRVHAWQTHLTLQMSLALGFHVLVLMCDAGQLKKGHQHAERHCSCVALGKLHCIVAAKCQTAQSLTPVRHTIPNPHTSQPDPHMASGHNLIVSLLTMPKDWLQPFAPMFGRDMCKDVYLGFPCLGHRRIFGRVQKN